MSTSYLLSRRVSDLDNPFYFYLPTPLLRLVAPYMPCCQHTQTRQKMMSRRGGKNLGTFFCPCCLFDACHAPGRRVRKSVVVLLPLNTWHKKCNPIQHRNYIKLKSMAHTLHLFWPKIIFLK